MELSSVGKKVVDDFIAFLRNADKGSELARLNYHDTWYNDHLNDRVSPESYLMIANVDYAKKKVSFIFSEIKRNLLKQYCIINLLSAEETSQILILARSKNYWDLNPKKEDLVEMDFYGIPIYVRKETV